MLDATAVDSDSLLAELSDSIPQGVPNSTFSDPAEADPFAALEELLVESTQALRDKAQYDLDLKARKRGFQGMSQEEVDFCNTRMAVFEMARQWEADKAIGVFVRFTCGSCGNYTVAFSRWMEHHNHRFNPTAKRWIAVSELREQFHESVTFAREDREVDTCEDCEEVADALEELPTLEEVLK